MKDLNVPDRTASEKFSYMKKTMAHKELKKQIQNQKVAKFSVCCYLSLGLLIFFLMLTI